MDNFFTWSMLATYSGATAATGLIVQFTKGLGFINKLPTQLYSYIVAFIILLAANFFTGGLTLETGLITILNAVIVSLASNGAFYTVKGVTDGNNKIDSNNANNGDNSNDGNENG